MAESSPPGADYEPRVSDEARTAESAGTCTVGHCVSVDGGGASRVQRERAGDTLRWLCRGPVEW